ncbi:unnamed protein product [Mucor hiemalis]
MNSQIQSQIISIIFVLFFISTLNHTTLLIHITGFIMFTSTLSIKSSTSSIPCSYISATKEKSSKLLKSLVKKTNKIKIATKHTPVTIPTTLSSEQKEAALPFLTEEPIKTKSSKSKTLTRIFKKLSKSKASKSNTQSTQYKLTFVPIINQQETETSSKAEVTEIVWYDDSEVSSIATEKSNDNNTATESAQRIWDEDNSVYSDLNKVVEWIGNGKESSNAILESYMEHFDFQDLKLEQAFRNLCSKLHLKGETQQIDRVLYQFSTRYFECNPQCIFGTVDIVHAIVYSLLLLNTDLHVAQGDYKKMSQSEFIKNTIDAISTGSPAVTRVRSFHSFDWVPLQRTPTYCSDSSSRSSICARSLDSSMPRNLSTLSIGSKTWESEIKNMLKHMYSNIRNSQINNPSTPPTSIKNNKLNRVSTVIKKSVGTMIKRKLNEGDNATITSVQSTPSVLQFEAVASHLQSTELPVSFTSNAPYYKEGTIVCKHLLASKNQRAKHRDWKECFMVIERSQLRMYKLASTSNGNGNGDWISNAQLIGAIDLKHTLANTLPSGYSRQRQHAFTLEQSNGAVHVFQAGSADQVIDWVSTCNYWAARESKEPLVGGISSMEYGWGHCLENSTNAMIHEWQSPASPTITSMLEESTQLEALHHLVCDLSIQLDQHRDIKQKMESKFSMSSKNGSQALNNWKNKSHYLLREIIKYQNYCNSIEKSLSLQASTMA